MPEKATRSSNQDVRFIAIALEIAAGLKRVLSRAAEIDLEAMNAKTIVARAGERAHAIRPIADEAETLSRTIVDLVHRMSAQSMRITRGSIAEFSEEIMVSYFDRANEMGRDSQHIRSVQPATQAARGRLAQARKAASDEARRLSRLLGEIDHTLLAATIVTSKFRIEASLSGSAYRANFEALVKKFEAAVADIQKFTRESRRALATGLGGQDR